MLQQRRDLERQQEGEEGIVAEGAGWGRSISSVSYNAMVFKNIAAVQLIKQWLSCKNHDYIELHIITYVSHLSPSSSHNSLDNCSDASFLHA